MVVGKYLQIYRWTLGPKKSVEALLFLDPVVDVKSPAGLDKKGDRSGPHFGSKKGSDNCAARYYVHMYIQQTQQEHHVHINYLQTIYTMVDRVSTSTIFSGATVSFKRTNSVFNRHYLQFFSVQVHPPLLSTCGHTLRGESSQLHSAYSYTVLEIK